MTNKFSLHVDTFKYWLDNFENITFDVEDEDIDETKTLLIKLTQNQKIDQKEIELLYALSMDNATLQKNDFIKFQAKKIVNFLNTDILQNIVRE